MKKSIIDLVEKATVLISMVALVVLNIDYFGTEEFGIELSYFLFLSILLTGNI